MKLDLDVNYNYKDDLGPNKDPDKYSDELGHDHCKLWNSRWRLGILKWSHFNRLSTSINGVDFVFTPDSITNSFVNSKRRVNGNYEYKIIEEYGECVQELIKEYRDTDYTIGSSIIFPVSIEGDKIGWTINIARGISFKVHDRIDYTLECIKRFYEGNDENPLSKALEKNKDFFDLFNDFYDYVDYFFLNDLIDSNGNVKSFTDVIDFSRAFPMTEEEYKKYINNTMGFVKKRNKIIKKWVDGN